MPTIPLYNNSVSSRKSILEMVNFYQGQDFQDFLRTYKLLEFYNNSWIDKSIKHIGEIPIKDNNLDLNGINDDNLWILSTALCNLSEFHFIVKRISRLKAEQKIIKNKLRKIVKMPLRYKDEDHNDGTNEGRDLLFELRLASRFIEIGDVEIPLDNPDIIIRPKNCNKIYLLECKRIKSTTSLLKNKNEAVNKLIEHINIANGNNLGVVALNITRVFNQGGEIKLNSENEDEAMKYINNKIEEFYNNFHQKIWEGLDYKFPMIILDFSDVLETKIIHWLNTTNFFKNPQVGTKKHFEYFKDIA